MSLSVQTIQTLYADLAQGNLSKILAFLDPNTKIYIPDSLAYGGVYQGADGFITLMKRVNQTWFSVQVIPDPVIASDGRIIVTGECIGKSSAAAHPIRFPFVHLWVMPHGLLTEVWLYYWDTARILTYLAETKA